MKCVDLYVICILKHGFQQLDDIYLIKMFDFFLI